MKGPQLIGILGGTFDPIHNGHLHVATRLLERIPFDQIRLLPCFQPVHRPPPVASPEHRLTMTQLACANLPNICVDDHEIKRQGQSYMIDTLRTLKQENPSDHLCLILGQDSFQAFPQWRQWHDIIDYCHLIVVNRPQANNHYGEELNNFIKLHQTQEISTLTSISSGYIYFCEIPPLDISATQLRSKLSRQIFDENAIPTAVSEYIQQHTLYR
jgi:nicotinate-nucleotide adenylyltransferase